MGGRGEGDGVGRWSGEGGGSEWEESVRYDGGE